MRDRLRQILVLTFAIGQIVTTALTNQAFNETSTVPAQCTFCLRGSPLPSGA